MNQQSNRELERMRTRWRRWLGARTRTNEHDWTNLLDTNWSGWVNRVLMKNGHPYHPIPMMGGPLAIRAFYSKAIDIADVEDMRRLDSIFAERKFEKKP